MLKPHSDKVDSRRFKANNYHNFGILISTIFKCTFVKFVFALLLFDFMKTFELSHFFTHNVLGLSLIFGCN